MFSQQGLTKKRGKGKDEIFKGRQKKKKKKKNKKSKQTNKKKWRILKKGLFEEQKRKKI